MTADPAPRLEIVARVRSLVGDGSFEWMPSHVRTADVVALLDVVEKAAALLEALHQPNVHIRAARAEDYRQIIAARSALTALSEALEGP
jgi:hypothetical protein